MIEIAEIAIHEDMKMTSQNFHLPRKSLHHADQLDQSHAVDRTDVHGRTPRRDQLQHVEIELGSIDEHIAEHLIPNFSGRR